MIAGVLPVKKPVARELYMINEGITEATGALRCYLVNGWYSGFSEKTLFSTIHCY